MAAVFGGGKAVKWTYHPADASREPRAAFLIANYGPEAYGRYWLLNELLMTSPAHEVGGNDGESMTAARLLMQFDDDGGAAGFMELLADLELLERTDGGGYRSPVVDDAAARMAAWCENGRAGGAKAAANRRARARPENEQ